MPFRLVNPIRYASRVTSAVSSRPTYPPVDLAALVSSLSDAALAELLASASDAVRYRRQQAEAALSWLRVVLAESERRGGSA